MKQSLHIIHVEDSPDDSDLTQRLLQKGGLKCEFQRVETRAQLFESLEHSPCDLILADCALPSFSGFQALEIAHALKPQIPFIFLSGTIGEETAIKSLKEGATDYVLKDRMSRLVPAVHRALSEANERTLLRDMRTRLHQARRLEALGTLAGGLAHDFNNLLQTIKAHVSLLSLELNRPDQIAEIAEKLDQIADRGAERMHELLVFARKTDAHFASVDVAALVRELVEAHTDWLPRNTNITSLVDEELPPIFADPGQVDRILTNLIMNARDAMPQGGSIIISAEVVQFDSSIPPALPSDKALYFCLKVSDTGRGMDEATRLQAFEPFFTTKSGGSGAGLGLSVVFGLMQMHNGLIDIESRLGEGTTVSLFFPLLQGSEIAPEKIKRIPPFQFLGEHKV